MHIVRCSRRTVLSASVQRVWYPCERMVSLVWQRPLGSFSKVTFWLPLKLRLSGTYHGTTPARQGEDARAASSACPAPGRRRARIGTNTRRYTWFHTGLPDMWAELVWRLGKIIGCLFGSGASRVLLDCCCFSSLAVTPHPISRHMQYVHGGTARMESHSTYTFITYLCRCISPSFFMAMDATGTLCF